ncbi:thioredoxin family protein [Tripterygium wilfordii]|uniref:Thioredoxin family protein n=1 Tax=Tripterygium wilfordii TaxID=458696 RepID=A0A7J7CN58_TRIWF|nr:thioredoxin H2-like [Tripterygium wilfordii]KAF5735517.1 thioredoxin family protein [Tripterygium wilfordii]
MGSALSFLFGGPAAATATATEDSSSQEPSSVTSFHSSARWKLHFKEAKKSPKLMVIDFGATWCGSCNFMESAIKAMASKFTDVQFSKIDIDELNDVAQKFKVRAIPTIVLVKKGKEVDRVVGAAKHELEKKIEKHRALQGPSCCLKLV